MNLKGKVHLTHDLAFVFMEHEMFFVTEESDQDIHNSENTKIKEIITSKIKKRRNAFCDFFYKKIIRKT